MPELTEANMADYLIIGHQSAGVPDRKIRAVYVTGDDKLPQMLVFKDHRHQTVALVNRDAVLSVERLGGEQPQAPQPLTLWTFPKGCVCTYTWNFGYGPGGGMVRSMTGRMCEADHTEIDRAGAAQPSGFQTTTQVMEHM